MLLAPDAAALVGGLGLVVGLLSRIAGLGVVLTMLGPVAVVDWRYGLFMNWYGNQEGHGSEYHLLAFALALVVVIEGAGAFSVDHILYQHRTAQVSTLQQSTRR